MKILILLIFLRCVRLMPISVPVDNQYADVMDRRPNAYYNRLPNRYGVQSDDDVGSVTDDYDDDDDYQQTDRPVPSSGQYSPSNNGYYGPILTENKIKKKRRRKRIKRPCIPIQSFGSPLFNNRLKREIEGTESGKTLGLFGNLLGGYGSPFYGYPPPNYGGYQGANFGGYPGGGNRPFFDNVKPQSDTGVSNNQFSNYGPAQYNPVGGYPCIPVSSGHIPHGGPLGFFGNGGLFDFGGGQSPSLNYPQTVIINRPPLFGNRPGYYGDRPGAGSGGSISSGSGIESDVNRPGFWGSVVDKLQEFVGAVNPQQVFTAIGDSLQGFGNAIQNAQPASAIRQGYDEFRSLLF